MIYPSIGLLTACETTPVNVAPSTTPAAADLAPSASYSAENSSAFYRANGGATAQGCLALGTGDGTADQIFAQNGFVKGQSLTGKTHYTKNNGASIAQRLIKQGREIKVTVEENNNFYCSVSLVSVFYNDGQDMIQVMGNELIRLGQSDLKVSGSQSRQSETAIVYVGRP